MKWLKNNPHSDGFLSLQSKEKDLENFRYSGKITSQVLSLLEDLVVNQHTSKTLLELDRIAETFILDHKCTPVFKNYRGFPATCCISINNQVVHGIPTEYRLKEGDVVSFDTGCNYQGAITDSAITCIYGNPVEKWHQEMITTAFCALHRSIKSIRIGLKTGIIGEVISTTARQNGFKVIETLGGHGIEQNRVHADPFISNKSSKEDGIRFQPGMVMAIEPILIHNKYSTKTHLAPDQWTILTEGIGAHVEHSIFIHDNFTEILTLKPNENYI